MVLWQPKAWCDRPIALEWAKLVFKKVIDADSAAGVCESEDSYLLIQDNLDSQKQPEYGTSTSSRSFKPTTTRPRGAAEQHGRERACVCVNVNEWKSVQTPDIDKSEL